MQTRGARERSGGVLMFNGIAAFVVGASAIFQERPSAGSSSAGL
jgi:hypothetical protein